MKGYRLTSSKAKAHGAKSRRDQVRLSGVFFQWSHTESHLLSPATMWKKKIHEVLPAREARLSLGVQEFIRDQSHRHRLCAKLTLVTQCPALPEVK